MRFTMKNGKRVILPDSNEDDWKTRKNMSRSTSQKDEMQHTHEDGTSHSHEGGDQPHTHDEETPNFEKMTKKALGEWAVDNGISVDSKKTKAKMIEEIKEQL